MTISERLNQLNLDAEKEGESINPVSLIYFLRCIELFNDEVMDNLVISLMPDNAIYATWQGIKKHCLCFRVNGTIEYFII